MALSQTGMALASGVFDFDNNVEQRTRWTMDVTRVPKAPFWYLVVVCLLYSAFGIVMAVAAFYLRRVDGVREQQARLMVEWGPELERMDSDLERKLAGKGGKKGGKKRSSSRSEDGTGLDDCISTFDN